MPAALILRFATPLIPATLLRRYKRFLADVEMEDGRRATVHCPNPGGMRGCSEPGRPVLLSDSANAQRKLRYTLEMIRMGNAWVGVNTQAPNRVVHALLESSRLAPLRGYQTVRREVACGASRLDFRLEGAATGGPDCWLEVKSTTWRLPGAERYAAFPDAVTLRGRRHLDVLRSQAQAGVRAVLLFHVGRADVHRFRPADEVDPGYCGTLRQAAADGVEVLAYRFRYGPGGVRLAGRLPVDL